VLAAYRAGSVAGVAAAVAAGGLTMALNRTAARAIVTSSRVDGILYSDLP